MSFLKLSDWEKVLNKGARIRNAIKRIGKANLESNR